MDVHSREGEAYNFRGIEARSMAFAGSFVHVTRSEDDGARKSKDEQDIEDFLSSIDDMTSGSSTNPAATTRTGTAAATGGISFHGGSSLFFEPSTQEASAGSVLLRSDGGTSPGDAALLDTDMPADWLKDLEALELDMNNPSASPAEEQKAKEIGNQQTTHRQQQHHAGGKREEILGMEPEILDDEVFDEDIPKLHASGMLESSKSGRQTPRGGEIRNAIFGRSASRSSRGGSGRAGSAGEVFASSIILEKEQAPGAGEQQLDWPGTLDMLGIPVGASGDTARPATSFRTKNTTGTNYVGVGGVSELASMPPPESTKETFPDFVEISDMQHLSQFPKPDNVLVLNVVSRASGGSGSGGGGDGDGSARGGEGGGGKGDIATGQKQFLPPPLRTVEVYLRPDVTWESVSDVYMAVMLSRGLLVRQQTEKTVIAEKAADATGDWAAIKLTVGVTRDKLRTLVVQFYAKKKTPILSLVGTMARFTGRAGDELYTAIHDALVERRMPLSFLAIDAKEVSLDPHYVRDLVSMYAHENLANLTRYALPLEEFVQREEERSAQLEATLLPEYRANGLAPPRPTRSKTLSAYPLTTRRPPVSSCGVEEAKEVIVRARENASYNLIDNGRSTSEKSDSVGNGDDGVERGESVAKGIRSLVRATWEDVKEWCDEEAEARVRRKDSQVRDRLLAVERHREALVTSLRDCAGGPAASGTPGEREFAVRFRPIADETVLCQCKAMHAKRVGQLYLTCNHLCFHSSVLGFTSQRVLPLLTVASISHASSALGMDFITLKNRGGESHSFGITAVEAGFPGRFHDLLQECFVLCKTEASRRASKKGAAEEKEPDEEQILAKVQRVAKANKLRETREAASVARGAAATVNDSTPSATLPVPAVYRRPPLSVAVISPLPTQWPPHQNMHDETVDAEIMAGAAAGGGVVEGGTEETVGKTESVKTSKENVGAGGKQQETGGGGGGGRAGSMMAMGIQAFLEESQKRS